MTEPSLTIALSVVVTIGERRWRARRCLEALLNQDGSPPFEIIVMDHTPHLGGIDFNGLRYIPCPEAASICHAKALGAAQARAPVVDFPEDHCVPQAGWAAAIARAFAEHPEVSAVAYAFENLNPVNWVSRSFLLLAYGPWMAPVASGPIATPSWMNVAYRRVILAAELDLARFLACEGLFLHRLRQAGHRFWQAGDARVRHLNHPGLLGSARDSAVWQRLFAATRADVEQWGWPRRLLYFCAAVPLSPSIIAWRLSRRLWARPEMRGPLLRSLPLVLSVYTYGAFSEALGYVAGPGDPALTFWIETGDPRGEPE